MRVLLSEGSSLTSRETVSCLGPLGHHVEVVDPDPFCIARFSRWVRRAHRCPNPGSDPSGYLAALAEVVTGRSIDVILPTHEQAWLLAEGSRLIPAGVGLAVASPQAFARVQSKIEFARLLDEIDLPQPEWRLVRDVGDLHGIQYPFWLKTPFSTAGQGVRHVTDDRSLSASFDELTGHADVLLAQAPAPGDYCQAQALFDHGRLIAVHTSRQIGTGIGGSAAARISTDHPEARAHTAVIGKVLGWHGGLTLDYFDDEGAPRFIECNPRMVEPGNATASGVNLADLQCRLSTGLESLEPTRASIAGVRTHGALALLLGVANRTGSRRAVGREILRSLTHRGIYEGSREILTPVRDDLPSVVPLAIVTTRLLAVPTSANAMAEGAVGKYAVGPEAIATIRRQDI